MVQKIDSDGAGERLAGLLGPDRSQAPTASAPEFPESPSDRERGKFRRSQFTRLTQLAVANDDGSTVTGKVESLLEELVAETIEVKGLLQRLLNEVEEA